MNIVWFQLGLIIGVLGMVVILTYYWCQNQLNEKDKEHMDCHSE